MVRRSIEADINKTLAKDKAVLLMGPRQVGKSTLVREMFGNDAGVKWFNGDDPSDRSALTDVSLTRLKLILGNSKSVIIDEAQKIPLIGNTIKLITDQMPGVKIIATGSSSFELASNVGDSLTGRKREMKLYPLSFSEMAAHHGLVEEERNLTQRLLFGYYPEVVTNPGDEKEILKELADSYLFKDILSLEKISKGEKMVKLLQAIALQIGSQVSYNELSQTVGLDTKTIEKYVDILEKCNIIFRIPSFARNLRNELKFSRKIYFYDLGIRNAVLGNFTPVELRTREEAGHMWENFVISERLKHNAYTGNDVRMYFWRTRQSKEIDFLEEKDGKLAAFECKYGGKEAKLPKDFAAAYPGTPFNVVTPKNIGELLMIY